MNTDYQRIEKAIRYLQTHVTAQPGLDELAAQIHLSPAYCQRLFKRWAGVSPKRFLQVLTVDYARRVLSNNSLLEAAQAAGLSGSSRLHDHFIAVEAVTPGQYKRAGEGLCIRYGAGDSRFGRVWAAVTDRGVCALEFDGGQDAGDSLQRLRRRWPRASLEADDNAIQGTLERVFATTGAGTPLLLQGSNFQIQVWRALLNIPAGALCSYGQLAAAVGRPTASRAVAQAVGANPVAYLIPCHRVLRSSGALGGYRWGTPRKQAIVAWEAVSQETGERLKGKEKGE